MKNVLFTLTGPSGSGKSTLERKLKEQGFVPLISTTTRPIRAGETDGLSYHFVTDERFDELLASDALVENVEYNGYKYGMSKAEVAKLETASSPGVFVCDPHGKAQMLDYARTIDLPVHRIFLCISEEEQLNRLLDRFAADMSHRPRDITEQIPHYKKVRKTFVDRIIASRMIEAEWQKQALLTPGVYLYDTVIPNFGAYSEKDVIALILNKADEILQANASASHFTKRDDFLYA